MLGVKNVINLARIKFRHLIYKEEEISCVKAMSLLEKYIASEGIDFVNHEEEMADGSNISTERGTTASMPHPMQDSDLQSSDSKISPLAPEFRPLDNISDKLNLNHETPTLESPSQADMMKW